MKIIGGPRIEDRVFRSGFMEEVKGMLTDVILSRADADELIAAINSRVGPEGNEGISHAAIAMDELAEAEAQSNVEG